MQDSPRRVAFDKRRYYFLWSACRAVHGPAATLDARDKIRGRRVWTKDVPILRTDHISIKGTLPGMWQASYCGVFDFKEVNRRFACVRMKT